MKIREMRVTPVAMADPPLRNAAGLHAPYALRTIIELVTDDGISGLGEMPGGVDISADLEAACEFVVGRDPFHLNAISRALEAHFGAAPAERPFSQLDENFGRAARRFARTYSPIEVACYDIMGKATGRPVADLLGGKVRERVPFSAYLFYKHAGAGGEFGFERDASASGWAAARQAEALTPEGVVAQAQAMCKAFGFESLKLKGGVFDPQVEVATVLALREAFGPRVPIRIDPNALWSVPTAIEWGRRMEGVLEYYEDPVRGQAAMAEVARAVNIPLATNMCTTAFEDLPGSFRLGSESIILSDHHFWGGLRASLELARICRAFGRGLSMHSNSHLGISLMAMAHLAAATPNLTYACDTHYPWQREEVLAGGRIPIEGGCVSVTDAPGLGIELDRAALARLHENYVRCGLTGRDDEAEMQKVELGWKFNPQRW
jgi:glucarate dehydratase